MSEYIEREAVTAMLKRECSPRVMAYLVDELCKIPAADARPVVLCRDCKYNHNTCLNHGKNQPMCDFTDRKLREDDFCSRGVKREES